LPPLFSSPENGGGRNQKDRHARVEGIACRSFLIGTSLPLTLKNTRRRTVFVRSHKAIQTLNKQTSPGKQICLLLKDSYHYFFLLFSVHRWSEIYSTHEPFTKYCKIKMFCRKQRAGAGLSVVLQTTAWLSLPPKRNTRQELANSKPRSSQPRRAAPRPDLCHNPKAPSTFRPGPGRQPTLTATHQKIRKTRPNSPL
jgi:hypothetical protein